METVIFKDQLDRIEAAILSQKIVLTFDETSVYTGLSKSDLYKKTSSRIIPHYKPRGKMIYFDRAELDKWLLQNRIATIDEIETQAQTYQDAYKKKDIAIEIRCTDFNKVDSVTK